MADAIRDVLAEVGRLDREATGYGVSPDGRVWSLDSNCVSRRAIDFVKRGVTWRGIAPQREEL